MDMVAELTPRAYYRLPWSLTDNAISWLEVTDDCNLACEGCYRPHIKNHKSLEQIAGELAVFKQQRKSDCMSIAGGDPLLHPQIGEIVSMVKAGGWKPIINTNGLALGRKLLRKLKDAGAYGFTFHIDTTQVRADSRAGSEGEHNALRQKFAEMLAEEGGLSCSFNQTVSADTLDQIKDSMAWAQQHPDIVHTMVFILFRTPELTGDFDFYANGKLVNIGDTYEKPEWGGDVPLLAKDVVGKIRELDPDYQPCAYLSGTEDPNATKWLLASRLASKKRGFGYVGPRFMEAVQTAHHFFKGTWLSYTPPRSNRMGRLAMAFFSLLDRQMRATTRRYLATVLKNPRSLFDRVHLQSFMIIQPIDILPDGRTSMCDGCPDMTVHEGKLRWSCRLEEIKEYGCFLQTSKRKACA
ncbi:MAG TPA: radical SAM protein [Xanthomonadales bacterium]|nr:radical SAM protein [Xanthomonadales bacterium]